MDSTEACSGFGAADKSTHLFPRHTRRDTAWNAGRGSETPPPSSRRDLKDSSSEDAFDEIELGTEEDSDRSRNIERGNTLDTIAALGLSFSGDDEESAPSFKGRFPIEEEETPKSKRVQACEVQPFSKWIKTIQRKAGDRRQTVTGEGSHYTYDNDLHEYPERHCQSSHKKSTSGSSFAFVTAVKSASISLASFSVAPHSRKTAVSSRQQRTDLSSKASYRGRSSEDSTFVTRGLVIDQAVTNRLLQRRKVLEELIKTEESYLADVKFLMTVYVTFLASIPSLSASLRASINRNLNEIVELHEEILGELHQVVPRSEYTQVNTPRAVYAMGHARWRSLDAGPTHRGTSWLQVIPGMTAEPQIAAAVAKIFAKKMNHLFIYEEYGAKYDFMIKDVASAYRTIPQWETYQRGIEALASSLASINNQQGNSKKASTIGDLLVKPIQRVCKYPLLFAELLKQTPVCDCPDSHMEIENVLIRLREATTEINRATDDPRMKLTMEKTWLLQDRLTFAEMPGIRTQNSVRALGHIHLCGVLHVSWQTKDSVDGQYLICILYRDYLLMASASRGEQMYSVQACINLAEINIEEVDNGRGLQCHKAPFSWKLVFECDHYLYEITLTACSPKEELEWKSRIHDRSFKGIVDAGDQVFFTCLSLPVKAMGPVFGKPGTVARRISIHRALTVGANSGRCQVIIKNTKAFKETASSASINRSQSLLTTNRIPVLCPSRSDRIRIEILLSDVWSRDILPYPGMTGRSRSEHLVRTSASSMMRKLSVASITSNFTKRSGSMASLHRTAEDGESGDYSNDLYMKSTPSRSEKHLGGDVNKPPELDRLSVIQDEKDMIFRASPTENLRNMSNRISNGTRHTLAPVPTTKSWSCDGLNVVTPPLRTSSSNQERSTSQKMVATEVGNLGSGDENLEMRRGSVASKASNSTPAAKESKGQHHHSGRRLRGRIVSGALNFFSLI